MRDYTDLGQAFRRGSGLVELQAETLRLVALAGVPVILGWLVVAAADLDIRRQPGMWLVALGLMATSLLAHLLVQRRPRWAAVALVVGLFGTVLIGLAVYPGSQMLYAFILVSVFAATFLGFPGYLAASAITSAAALALVLLTDYWPDELVGPVVLLIWACGIACWLATRSTRVALDWSWSSYVQALEKTEALRDRQGELVRISHDLAVACERLESANRELDRARREAEQARRLKSQFAASISHELRTPLNLIIGFSEMLTEEVRTRSVVLSSERVRGDLETIHRNALHISSLIDDVLDLSQVDAHRLALQKRPVSLVQIVEEARSTLGTLFEEGELDLQVDLPADLPVLNIDPLRIRQVLINLLSNAARHTDEGEIGITARLDGAEVIVSVSDTGEGISPEDLPGVFDAFRQSGEVSRRRGGSGLGLAITKRFVEMHGGNIWAESSPNEGSTFHFSLPLHEQVLTDLPAPKWNRLLGPASADAAKRTLLVVGSDPEPGRILCRYLDDCQVLQASGLGEVGSLPALESAQALIITDPADRYELAGLAVGESDDARLPVLACSLRTQKQIGRELGVSAYLVKPVSREALVAALHDVTDGVTDRIRDLLIVDDDAELNELLARMVGSALPHCRIARAGDGVGALAAMRSKRPDAVLLDLLMPGMDGYGVLTEMAADPLLRDVPVVVVTARGVHEETITATSLNISRAGGLTIGELVSCMQACLDALLSPRAGTGG